MKPKASGRLFIVVSLGLAPLRAGAQQALETQVAAGRAVWDRSNTAGGAPVATQDSPAPGAPAPAFSVVDRASLKEANEEILALRGKVWDGRLEPARFYPEIQGAFERRFGPGYGPKIKAFLDGEAAAAPRSAQTVDFAGMTPAEREGFFKKMPKGGELHVHLTGAVPGDKILEIGEQLGTKFSVAGILSVMRIPDLSAYGVDASKDALTAGEMSPALRKDLAAAMVTRDGETFPQFLDKWKVIGAVIRDDRSYYPMIRYLADYAKEQNIVYLEIMVTGFPAVQHASVDAAKRVEAETGVTIRLMISDGWNASKAQDDEAIATAQALSGDGVVGFNMVADERLPPLNHYEAFKPLRDRLARLSVSLHAGEQSGTASNIVNDLLLNPKRYGHATHVEEDPIAETVVYENKIPVEVSLISNEKTLVLKDLTRHPETKFLAWGVPVVPSTDDPGVFGSTLSQEYQLSQSQFNLSWDQLKEMSRNAVRYSFVDDAAKAKLMRDLDRRLSLFEASEDFRKRFAAPPAAAAPRPVQLRPLDLSLR